MFRVESVYIRQSGEPVDNGDPFTITLSRNELRILEDELRNSLNDKAYELWAEIRKELNK